MGRVIAIPILLLYSNELLLEGSIIKCNTVHSRESESLVPVLICINSKVEGTISIIVYVQGYTKLPLLLLLLIVLKLLSCNSRIELILRLRFTYK